MWNHYKQPPAERGVYRVPVDNERVVHPNSPGSGYSLWTGSQWMAYSCTCVNAEGYALVNDPGAFSRRYWLPLENEDGNTAI